MQRLADHPVQSAFMANVHNIYWDLVAKTFSEVASIEVEVDKELRNFSQWRRGPWGLRLVDSVRIFSGWRSVSMFRRSFYLRNCGQSVPLKAADRLLLIRHTPCPSVRHQAANWFLMFRHSSLMMWDKNCSQNLPNGAGLNGAVIIPCQYRLVRITGNGFSTSRTTKAI